MWITLWITLELPIDKRLKAWYIYFGSEMEYPTPSQMGRGSGFPVVYLSIAPFLEVSRGETIAHVIPYCRRDGGFDGV